MRALRWVVLSACLAAVAAAFVTVSCAPPAEQAAAGGATADTLARGQYLTTLMGCQDCHTPGAFYGAPDASRQLSGSEVGWQGPWGVTYARNLTPDHETGLGAWTRAQIVTALRTGQRPDGSPLLPPMPWPNYAHLTDADAYAVAAYLQSLPAVAHHVPDRIAAGQPVKGPAIAIPPPSAWDAPRTAQAEGTAAAGGRARP
jgi:mono/diheme cytochrome c family protein